jgi:hypothetical protein
MVKYFNNSKPELLSVDAQSSFQIVVSKRGKFCNADGMPYKQRTWHVADVLCKMKRSKGLVAALVVALGAVAELCRGSLGGVHCGLRS